MPEENQDVNDIQQESAPANESESTSQSDEQKEMETFLSEHGGDENQSNQSGDETQGNENHQEEQENAKPTRAERRIQQLLSKLKTEGVQETQGSEEQKVTQIRTDIKTNISNQNQGLLTQEEINNGMLDPEGFQQRLDAHIQEQVQKQLGDEKRQQMLDDVNRQYSEAINKHNADLESVSGKIDPDLEDIAAAQYEAINYQINPFTGKKEFVPAVLMSEIVERLKPIAQRLGESNRKYASRVSQSSAIPSTSVQTSSKPRPDTQDFGEFERQYNQTN